MSINNTCHGLDDGKLIACRGIQTSSEQEVAPHKAWHVNALIHFRNSLRINDQLATSGMPQPDDFAALQPADFDRLIRAMDACTGQRVFVHCAANMRVSPFVLLHRLRKGANRTTAEHDLKRIWEPDGVWREFVNARG